MRIVHVTDRRTDRGGAHRHLLSVARAQAERGHEVHLVAGADEATGTPPGVVSLVVPGLEARTAVGTDLDAVLGRLAPDVVHVHTVANPQALAVAADHGAVFTVQDHRWFCPSRGKWTAEGRVCRVAMSGEACAGCFLDAGYFADVLALTQARLAALRGREVVVLSRYMRDELVSVGLAPGRVHVVPPFVDFGSPADVPPHPDEPACVLFVGRLVEAKGALDAAEAWRRSRVDLPLVVAGTGPLRERMEAEGARVLGWVAHERLPALFRRARALLMPSRWQEPFGIAGLEALAHGVPVAAWRAGGIAEWHPGPLAEWGDVDGLAGALRRAIGTRAAAPEGFGRDALMDRLETVYSGARRSP